MSNSKEVLARSDEALSEAVKVHQHSQRTGVSKSVAPPSSIARNNAVTASGIDVKSQAVRNRKLIFKRNFSDESESEYKSVLGKYIMKYSL